MPKKDLGKLRQNEAKAAAKVLGVTQVEFLQFHDGLTLVERPMKIKLIDSIRHIKPDVVFIHSSFDRQADHSLFHQLCCQCIDAAKGPWFQETKAKPHLIDTVLGFEVWHPIPHPQLVIDISSVIDIKMNALQQHKSQISSVAYDQAFHGLAKYRGVMTHMGSFGEAFEVISSSVNSNFHQLFSRKP